MEKVKTLAFVIQLLDGTLGWYFIALPLRKRVDRKHAEKREKES